VLAIEAGQTVVVDRAAAVALADKHGWRSSHYQTATPNKLWAEL
jgi:hypothetical protein